MEIIHIAPDFPLCLNNFQVFVTLYNFYTGTNFLLGQDLLKKLILVIFDIYYVTFSTTKAPVIVPASNDYTINVQLVEEDQIQCSLQDLSKVLRFMVQKHYKIFQTRFIKIIQQVV